MHIYIRTLRTLELAKSFLLRAMMRLLAESWGCKSWWADENGICKMYDYFEIKMIRKNTSSWYTIQMNIDCTDTGVASGSGHVAWEPVNGSTIFVETHLSHLHCCLHYSFYSHFSHSFLLCSRFLSKRLTPIYFEVEATPIGVQTMFLKLSPINPTFGP